MTDWSQGDILKSRMTDTRVRFICHINNQCFKAEVIECQVKQKGMIETWVTAQFERVE